jgi:hypothetical protein
MIYFFIIALCTIFSVQVANALEGTFPVELNMTSVTPVFIQGHEGDMTQVQGFDLEAEYLLDDFVIATTSLTATDIDPPVDLTRTYEEFILDGSIDIPGIGTAESVGTGMTLYDSDTATTGNMYISWTSVYINGTDALTNVSGIEVGIGNANIFTEEGESAVTIIAQEEN